MKHLLITMIGAVLLFSCEDKPLEVEERGIWVISVVDLYGGSAVPNAEVGLYKTVDDWAFDQNQLMDFVTDEDGNIVVPNLTSGEYYFDAVSGQMNNWQSPFPGQIMDGFVNYHTIYVQETIDGYISDVDEVFWEITAVLDENGNNNLSRACEVGDRLSFTRAGAYTRTDTDSNCGEPFVEGSWWGVGTSFLNLLLEEGAVMVSTQVTALSEESFSFRFEENSETIEYVLTKI